MADIIVTPADVGISSSSTQAAYTAGEAIAAGETFYVSSTTGKAYRAVNDTLDEANAVGVALTKASGDTVPFQGVTKNKYTVGGTVAVGQIYCVSGNAGKIAPYADVGSADYVTILGIGVSSTEIDLQINNSDVQKP